MSRPLPTPMVQISFHNCCTSPSGCIVYSYVFVYQTTFSRFVPVRSDLPKVKVWQLFRGT